MNTTAQIDNSPRLLIWFAGIAVILFSALGIAAIMGWIPTSMGRGSDNTEFTDTGKQSTNASKRSKAPASYTSSPVLVASNAAGPAKCSGCGVIESTRKVSSKGEGSGIGAVGGAVVGGLIGNQVGAGRGNTVATAIGAVGGAMAGNEVEKRVKANVSYEVTVRLDDGSSRVISEANAPTWHAGDRVKIVGGAIRANP